MPLEFEGTGAAAGLGGLRDVRVTDSQGSAHRPTGRWLGLTVCVVGGPPQGDRFEGETHGREGAEVAPQPDGGLGLSGLCAGRPRRCRVPEAVSSGRLCAWWPAAGCRQGGRGEPEGSEE